MTNKEMTMDEMKATIRKQVNDNWDYYKLMIREYGIESYKAKISRISWVALFDLWETLFPNENWRY